MHLAPFFGAKPLHRIEVRDIEAFIAAKRRESRAPKTVLNHLGLLHSISEFGQRRGWTTTKPCKLVDKPRVGTTDADIRFLDEAELEALLRAAPRDDLGGVDRLMWLTAAMTGLRQGELLALRWRDVDWLAGRFRVRRSFVRGEFGTPKSHGSSRSVPLADRVAAELDAHNRRPPTAPMTTSSSGTRTSAPRSSARVSEALQGRRQGRRDPRRPLPRPPPHVQHADGGRRRPDADAPGMMGHRDTRRP